MSASPPTVVRDWPVSDLVVAGLLTVILPGVVLVAGWFEYGTMLWAFSAAVFLWYAVFSAFRLARATFRDITVYNDGISISEWKLFRQADAEALIFWNTITSTAVELGDKGDGETFSFVIDSNGRRRVIVEERTHTDAKMETIVNLVNKHTPHIPYTWQIMGSGFVKVPRGLIIGEDRQ